ncbi:MAG: ribosomal protein S18-alanine N-acetyltransferase [Devosia sp.]|jgi:ribosomal-protein-alanine N-acetyltransferase|uniref:ribosomal protein S18-alanine N-acetyltransferase n=1 Tax=Devosia sp. XGJD_8 TaxID=3391187 RepID=UPI001DF84300|nr:ribosomal protein S18-alanine N-acetyltransferase [Alphaproteobacteria bacterium]MBU1562274.1 ribosomal protein S18-alanine N-acetyltransferase [Alphaproteobacteria bacterium]MBU2302754.1 ribosomal protein S18-alanine N-acetyltransferase [Alphaproteobacteria bacterium]MBU2369323.1 ribosomal protein S18-alanine N-acetyltransferase [Alphaproteobacteria bacterium]
MIKLWMAPAGLHIEPGRVADAKELARIHALGFYRGWPVGEFESFLADDSTPVYVACDARRRIAGFALIRIAADEAELLTIAVDPKWRGKRIGQALLRAAFDDLLRSPARRMFLEVSEDNGAAIKLYQREGFATISSRKGYYPKPDGSQATALVMARDLG